MVQQKTSKTSVPQTPNTNNTKDVEDYREVAESFYKLRFKGMSKEQLGQAFNDAFTYSKN